ncbi:hypothetical protein GCM10010317_054190 [Streptomyces mirabilis]|nr:hypothetical protein GCM10010317_054190 [Streptomyces mirabilis]
MTAEQAADSPQFIPVLNKVRVRVPVGRPRTRPDAVAGDKAYSSRCNRAHLRRRGIKAVIPEKRDQAASRKKKGTLPRRPLPLPAALAFGIALLEDVLDFFHVAVEERQAVRGLSGVLPRRG